MIDFESILPESSRKLTDLVIREVGEDPGRFMELLELSLADKGPVSARASWALYLCYQNHRQELRSSLTRILRVIRSARSQGLKKNLLKLLSFYPFKGDEDMIGELFDYTLEQVVNYAETPAVRIYSMQIASRLVDLYPELKDELMAAIETGMTEGSTGFRSIGKKQLEAMKKGKQRRF